MELLTANSQEHIYLKCVESKNVRRPGAEAVFSYGLVLKPVRVISPYTWGPLFEADHFW